MIYIDKIKYGSLPLKSKELTLKDDDLSKKLVQLGLYDKLFDMPPPSNTSSTTKKELSRVAKVTKNISEPMMEFCIKADKDLVQVFVDYLKRHNINDITKQRLDDTLDLAEPFLYRLKEYYNRPRPHQLAIYYGLELNILIESKTIHTPAYPSGHSFESHLLAELLSQKYPKHKSKLMQIANLIGMSRLLIGVHYKSDRDFGIYIAKLLTDNNLVDIK